jgi:hypothetical protein
MRAPGPFSKSFLDFRQSLSLRWQGRDEKLEMKKFLEL